MSIRDRGMPLRRSLRRLHGSRQGIVAEQLLILVGVVFPIAATAPYAIFLLVRFFYRLAVVVSGPFT